jgi:hypothetical protein
MTRNSNHSTPTDICLMLRAHAEELWLGTEVLPVVRQLEQPGAVPEDQLGAALAYLELLWVGARKRAAETESAFAALVSSGRESESDLQRQARLLHTAVRSQRNGVSDRVGRLIAPPNGVIRTQEHAVL